MELKCELTLPVPCKCILEVSCDGWLKFYSDDGSPVTLQLSREGVDLLRKLRADAPIDESEVIYGLTTGS